MEVSSISLSTLCNMLVWNMLEIDWHFLRNQMNASTLDVQYTPFED